MGPAGNGGAFSLSTAVDKTGPVNYSCRMIEVRQTEAFGRWLSGLRDQQAVARIVRRLRQVERGLLGDAKYFHGIGELRIDHGPGYRIYFVRRGEVVIVLLCGGDKGTQRRDIAQALDMARDV